MALSCAGVHSARQTSNRNPKMLPMDSIRYLGTRSLPHSQHRGTTSEKKGGGGGARPRRTLQAMQESPSPPTRVDPVRAPNAPVGKAAHEIGSRDFERDLYERPFKSTGFGRIRSTRGCQLYTASPTNHLPRAEYAKTLQLSWTFWDGAFTPPAVYHRDDLVPGITYV